jgi:hypothetical protein
MGARLLSGETIRLGHAAPDELAVGDVVAFVGATGEVVAHRIVRIDPGPRFWTRGDGSPELDSPWGADQLVGRISRDGRLGRAIARWPRLAVPLGAALRVRRAWDFPSAALTLAIVVTMRVARCWRRT